MRIVPYIRVSTPGQASGSGFDRQLNAIRQRAERDFPHYQVSEPFQECVSGGKPLLKRDILVAAIASLQPGDILMVEEWSRFSRGGRERSRAIEVLIEAKGARVEIAQQDPYGIRDELNSIFGDYYSDRRANEQKALVVKTRDQHE